MLERTYEFNRFQFKYVLNKLICSLPVKEREGKIIVNELFDIKIKFIYDSSKT